MTKHISTNPPPPSTMMTGSYYSKWTLQKPVWVLPKWRAIYTQIIQLSLRFWVRPILYIPKLRSELMQLIGFHTSNGIKWPRGFQGVNAQEACLFITWYKPTWVAWIRVWCSCYRLISKKSFTRFKRRRRNSYFAVFSLSLIIWPYHKMKWTF